MSKENKAAKIKTILFQIFSWIFGVFFILGGVIYLFDGIIGGSMVLLGALLLLPPVFKQVHIRIPKLQGWLSALIAAILIIGGVSILPEADSEPEIAGVQDSSQVEELNNDDEENTEKEDVEKADALAEEERLRKEKIAEEVRIKEEQQIQEKERLEEEAKQAEEEKKKAEAESEKNKLKEERSNFDSNKGNVYVAATTIELIESMSGDANADMYMRLDASESSVDEYNDGGSEEEFLKRVSSANLFIVIDSTEWSYTPDSSKKDLAVTALKAVKKIYPDSIARVSINNEFREVATAEYGFWSGEPKVELK